MDAQKRRRQWRVFREGEGVAAGPPAYAYVLLFAFCIALGQWSVDRYHAVLLWPANGVLLAAVLQLYRRQALMVLGACLAINLAGNVIRHDTPLMIVMNVVLNFGEVLFAAALARRWCGATLDLRRPIRLARFVAAIAIPVFISALIGVSFRNDAWPLFLWDVQFWVTIEGSGFLVTTPTLLLFAQHSRFTETNTASRNEKIALMALLVVVTSAVFAQNYAPVLFLTFLPLMLIAFRLPPHWSALAVGVMALIGGAFSLNGIGPITLSNLAPVGWPQNDVVPILNVLPVFHLYVCAILAVAFGASTVLTERRRLEAQLKARTAVAQAARAVAEEAERRVLHMALHDADTGLLNRQGLEGEVGMMLDARYGRGVYVAALGVDRFTSIRTAIGPELASALLAETARRLSGRLRQAHVARLSSTSLGVALRAASLDEAMERMIDARTAFAEPIAIAGSRIDVALTIGMSAAPDHGADEHTLTQRAQVALDQAYAAKQDFAVFDAAVERTAASGLALMSELRAGLFDGTVWLAHQPKLDLHTGEIASVESLIRWSHVEKGPVPPDAFIPLAEETGFIGPLTDWVFDRALADQAELKRAGHDLVFAVNISARSLCDASFAERLIAIAKVRNADAARITLEITETAVMARPDVALANLEALKAAGFAIAVDDYGAGMSSLSYLKRIPADELKIDACFIRTLAEEANDAVLVRSTIDLGHSLGLKVVAEGVEDQKTLDLLALFGCDIAQGYLISRPMPLNQLAAVVEKSAVKPQRAEPKLKAVAD